MKTTNPVDAARIELLLSDLRLPAIKLMWAKFAEQSDKEGWPAARFLAALAEHEIADRGRRRIERHLAEARLPVGKTLASFEFEAVPMVSKAQVMALTAGDSWLHKGANLLLFGPSGRQQAPLQLRDLLDREIDLPRLALGDLTALEKAVCKIIENDLWRDADGSSSALHGIGAVGPSRRISACRVELDGL
jgi:IstB-like ATP binding protein